MIDCYSRRMAGWAAADHRRTELVEDALKVAALTRGCLAGAVSHSDHRSVVYTSKDYAKLCKDLGVTQSITVAKKSAQQGCRGLPMGGPSSYLASLIRDRPC